MVMMENLEVIADKFNVLHDISSKLSLPQKTMRFDLGS
jgi:hypothetical protein